jgi:SMC interacting uncharacterized protein involved in chromosome segregation
MRSYHKMTDRDEMLNLLDGFKESIVKLMDERDKIAGESDELRSARREAEEKAWAAEEKIKELTGDLEKAKAGQQKAEKKLTSVSEELKELKSKADELESAKSGEISELQKERDDLKKEMDEITDQLSRVSELYREASAEKEALEEKVDLSDLLAVYITLIETVFFGKPHARILYTLHDVKTSIPRKNLATSTGIMPAVVKKAVHDLANAELVNYDEENDEVTLAKDILRRG